MIPTEQTHLIFKTLATSDLEQKGWIFVYGGSSNRVYDM